MVKTISQLYLDARRVLITQEDDQMASMMARSLVCHITGKTHEQVIAQREMYVSEQDCALMDAAVARLMNGEPLPYVLGKWEFYGLELNVSPDVLIPRIDTEVLVHEAIETMKDYPEPPRMLDLCCGSGCIGVTLGQHFPQSRIVMVDMSDNALRVARSNVMKHTMGSRISCVKANALKEPPANIGTFDLIVSNPPYIKSMEVLTLDPSVRDFEPLEALDGGNDGYMFYRAIVKKWKSALRENGWLMFEVGEEQAQYVALQMKKAGFKNIRIVKDTAETERVVIGQLVSSKLS